MAKFNSDLFAKGIQNRREPYFVQDDEALDLSHFYIPQHYQETLKSLLVPAGMIMDRIEKLAYDISQDYEGQTIHMLCVLKGGSTFFGDLSQALRRFHDCKFQLRVFRSEFCSFLVFDRCSFELYSLHLRLRSVRLSYPLPYYYFIVRYIKSQVI